MFLFFCHPTLYLLLKAQKFLDIALKLYVLNPATEEAGVAHQGWHLVDKFVTRWPNDAREVTIVG